ncbi:MAG: ABC transporter ATP-binding protein [Thermoanaerobaculia bacterium]
MESSTLLSRSDGGHRAGGGDETADRRGRSGGSAGKLLTFSLEHVSVTFGETAALRDVSLEFRTGEIHALLGENGAGKSTLGNVLGGLLQPDSGRVRVDGRVGHVHQHFALPPGLTSAECLALENEGLRRSSPALLEARFRRIEERVGLDLGDPRAEAASLPVGARQRLEFARARSRDPDLLILDEPTAVLAPPEVEAFMRSVRQTASRGTAVVFITHRLAEVFGFTDRVSVLRRGRLVSSRPASDATPASLAAEFLDGAGAPRAPARRPGPEVLRLRGFRDSPAELSVREGEIIAIAGVDGNGQQEVANAVGGRADAGPFSAELFGATVSASTFRARGASVIPGDRRREGLILDFTIQENLRLAEPIPGRDPAEAARLIERFGIDPPIPDAPVRSLSGGNQQKVVLARELARRPRFLLAVSPTRGLDLASSRMTFETIRDAAASGAAVLLVTSDQEEARELADSFFVIYRRRLTGPFRSDAEPSQVGAAMAGVPAAAARPAPPEAVS